MYRNFIILVAIFFGAGGILFAEEEITLTIPPDYPQEIIQTIQKAYTEISLRLKKDLHLPNPNKVEIIVCKDGKELSALAKNRIPTWTLGVALPYRNTIGINGERLSFFGNSLTPVLKHEVCHLYIAQWERENRYQIPQWLNEGICEWISDRLHLDYQDKIFEIAVWKTAIPFVQIEEGFPDEIERAARAYLQSRSMVEYLIEQYGSNFLVRLFQDLAQTKDFDQSIFNLTKENFYRIEARWLASITPGNLWFWRIIRLFSLFSILAFLAIWAFLRQKRKSQKLMKKWEEEEQFYDSY